MPGRRRQVLPETLTCRACAEPFHWDGTSMRRPHYCPRRTCKRARQNDAAYRYYLAHRTVSTSRSTRDWQAPPPLPKDAGPAQEPSDRVEALYQAAKAARLARERATGQRTYTIEADSTYVRADGRVVTVRGGWLQKPGAGDFSRAEESGVGGWNA